MYSNDIWMEIENEMSVEELISNKDVIKVGTFNCSNTICEYDKNAITWYANYDEENLIIIEDDYEEDDEVVKYVRYGMSIFNDWVIQKVLTEGILAYQDDISDYEDEKYIMFYYIALAIIDTENNKTYDIYFNEKKGKYYFIFDGLRYRYYTVDSHAIDGLSSDYDSNAVVVDPGESRIWIDFRAEKIKWTKKYTKYLQRKWII